MDRAIIDNLEDDLLADYRAAAEQNARSLEAELHEGLRRARPVTGQSRRAMAEAVRRLLPEKVPGFDGTEIIRWYRDTNGGRDIDAFGG
jgi:plasmid stability protein